VPWCETCSRYLTPSSLADDGTCPTCGRQVGETDQALDQVASADADAETTPWHFKLLVVALVVYLGWRFIEIFV